jgi:amino acid transporter
MSAPVLPPEGIGQDPNQLKRGALGLPAVIMQGVTHIAPAFAVLLSLQFAVQQAGVTAPLTYLAAFVVVLLLAVTLAQLARHLPSAGGYFTFVSRTVSPRTGFLVGWIYFLYSPLATGVVLTALGSVLEGELKAQYNIDIYWWIWLIVGVVIVGFLVIRGVELAARTMIIGGVIEIGIVLVLSVWGLFAPGSGGTNVSGFNPANIPNGNGFFLAVVFTIFTFTGWEASASLGEESRDPKRNVPRGIIGSAIILGAFLVVSSWAETIGWGTAKVASLSNSSELPSFVLAHRFWHGAWLILGLALLNSVIAGSIAYTSVTSRMWYAMARAGALPKALGAVHPESKAPVNAILANCGITLVVALLMGSILGSFNQFVFYGIGLTFALIFVYGMANLGAFLYYRRERRAEFSYWLHVIFPVLSTVALLWIGYKTIHPFPAAPNNWAPIIVAGWFVAGLVVLLIMRARGREAWLLQAGQVAFESGDEGAAGDGTPALARERSASLPSGR